jgi:malonyl-CoA O-methyltransferase
MSVDACAGCGTDAEALSNVEAYDRWAPSYPPLPHNPLMRAEQAAMLALLPEVSGLCALDLACGTGRYGLLLEQRGAASVVGTDMSQEMLRRAPLARRVRADMTQLPFANAQFDLVVSGLAVGHAPQLEAWMREVSRVLVPGGQLVYSDFHPDAACAGMTRSFTDGEQRKHTLLHSLYDLAAHQAAATAAGLQLALSHEIRVGRELQEPFEGSAEFYRRWHGLAVVLVLRMWKAPV